MGKLSKLQMRKLREMEYVSQLNNTLKNNKTLYKNPAKMLEALVNGSVRVFDAPNNSGAERLAMIFQQVWESNKYRKQRQAFYNLIKKIIKQRGEEMLAEAEIVNALATVAQYSDDWVRDLETWQPTSHNRRKQFSSLVRHLFALYEVPEFMDKAFYEDEKKYIRWFIHIGKGQNIRKVDNLPIKLTSKMAHHFLQTPEYFSIPEALRYGQMMGMGGNLALVRYILATRLGQSFENEDFWETVIRFLVQNPMLDPIYLQPIVDYIYFQKYQTREVVRGRGVIEMVGPPNPDFTMKGRTMPALLRLVEAWHEELNRMKKQFMGTTWHAIPIADFEFVSEEGDLSQKTYQIRQLLTADELSTEGDAMRHCVASYVYSCRKGNCSIWSMTVEDYFGKKDRVLTLELNQNRVIVQARGKYNAEPDAANYEILARWAMKNNISLSRWI